MLTFLRRSATSWVIKILFGFLVLSFAVWGIGDIFRGPGRESVVASVGGMEITGRDFIEQYRRRTQEIRGILSTDLSPDMARKLGLVDMVLATLLRRAIFDEAARELGLTVGDELVSLQITEDPQFHDDWDRFDEYIFRQKLIENGYNEETYVSSLRLDIARNQLVSSLSAWLTPPKTLVVPLLRHRQEKRVVEKVLIAVADIPGFDSPDEASLTAYYEENAEKFKSPELRDITVLALKADDLVPEIVITEERLRELYEDRKTFFTSPERVNLEQILVDDEEAANRARKMLDEGADFLEVAKQVAGQNKEETELSWNHREDLLEEIADAVFALEEGDVSPPLESPFGWHVIRVTEKEAESLKSFEEVKDEIREELAAEESLDALYNLIKEIEDAFAAGASLEEAARQLNLETIRIAAIDSQGRDAAGNAIENLPGEKFISTVFSTPEGEQSDLKETQDNGFYVLRVNRIMPPAPLTLDQAREKVTEGWREVQREKTAKAQAEMILEKIKTGADFATVAKELGLEMETTAPFLRASEVSAGLTVELASQIFDARIGDSFMARSDDGYLVVRLAAIEAADPDPENDDNKEAIEEIRRSLVNDIIQQYGAALHGKYKITVNHKVIDSLL